MFFFWIFCFYPKNMYINLARRSCFIYLIVILKGLSFLLWIKSVCGVWLLHLKITPNNVWPARCNVFFVFDWTKPEKTKSLRWWASKLPDRKNRQLYHWNSRTMLMLWRENCNWTWSRTPSDLNRIAQFIIGTHTMTLTAAKQRYCVCVCVRACANVSGVCFSG